MKARLKAFSEKEAESKAIEEIIKEDERIKSAETILSFFPMKSEPDISFLIDDDRVALPYIKDGNMEFSKCKVFDKGPYGFLEPRDKMPAEYSKAIILVPLLAFDERLYRLGRGGGFYDRYLSENKDRLFSIGIAFSISKVDQVPIEAFDQRLDSVIYPIK